MDVICNYFRVCPAKEDCAGAKPHDEKDCDVCVKYGGKAHCIPYKEYILCAATHYQDKVEHEHQPYNIKTGYVVCGWRHDNCFVIGQMITCIHYIKTQGFITNFGRFVDRQEAYDIAFKADQLLDKTPSKSRTLLSEDLY